MIQAVTLARTPMYMKPSQLKNPAVKVQPIHSE